MQYARRICYKCEKVNCKTKYLSESCVRRKITNFFIIFWFFLETKIGSWRIRTFCKKRFSEGLTLRVANRKVLSERRKKREENLSLFRCTSVANMIAICGGWGRHANCHSKHFAKMTLTVSLFRKRAKLYIHFHQWFSLIFLLIFLATTTTIRATTTVHFKDNHHQEVFLVSGSAPTVLTQKDSD